MNKYYTLFSTLLCFVSIRRYDEIFCYSCRKVSTVTTTNETEIIGCCHPRNWVKYCNFVLCRIRSETPRFTEGEELLLFDFLSNTSHYDSRQTPTCLDGKPQSPLVVRTSMFVYFIGNFDAQSLQFETHLLFRHRWRVRIASESLTTGICDHHT